MFVPLKLATDARGLEFAVELDRRIDDVARRALFEAIGMGAEDVGRKLGEGPEEDGIVVGDETRLRQIVTNLARCVVLLACLSVRLPVCVPAFAILGRSLSLSWGRCG